MHSYPNPGAEPNHWQNQQGIEPYATRIECTTTAVTVQLDYNISFYTL